jgi:hypothetical protein
MAKHLTASLNASINTVCTDDETLASAQETWSASFPMSLVDGTGNGAGNIQWLSERTLTAGGSENLDLYGVLLAFDGTAITFVNVKAIIIVNTSLTNTLIVGGAGANAWLGFLGGTSHTLTVPKATSASVPGVLVLMAPGGMTAGATNRLLKMQHGALDSTNLTYKIGFLGQQ